MGTQEGERDWVDVANDLLSKCHVNLRLRKLTDCDASAFITLYESILGEKVPDYIASPCSQEDDIHNVQSVIDSLSLDYLQISLSHITGENIVRGDRESLKNLLEIFDGLLEYLKEEVSEESQDGELHDGPHEDVTVATEDPENSDVVGHREAEPETAPTSSCGGAEEKGSESELIGLGISARTFTVEQKALHSAIALQPPNQSDTPHRPDTDPPSPSQPPTAAAICEGQTTEEASPVTIQTSVPVAKTLTNGQKSPPLVQPPAVSEDLQPSEQGAETETQTEAEALEPTNGGPRRVLFHTQPDVLFLTLQDEMAATSPSPPDTEEEDEEDLNDPLTQLDRRRSQREETGHRSEVEDFEDPLLNRRQRNKKAEEELHHISEKLSHRLDELDQMLKRVLSESGESSDVKEEDELSQHSEGVRECGRQSTETPEPESTQQTSSSPCRPLQGQLGEAMAEALSLDDGRQTNVSVSGDMRRKETHQGLSQRRHVKNKAYEKELKRYEDKQRADVDTARLRAQEAEQQYREAILSDVSQASRPSAARTKSQHRSGRDAQTSSGRRRHGAHRKATSMTVKENELLPVLLEELPHLHITPHALGRMWEQQMQQVDRLHALSSSRGQRRNKLSSQVEEVQRKHNLLVEIIRKEQDHNKRLRDFRERIQQQKLTQNRLREQRQQIARAKKYHSDYHVQHRARLMRARTKEERMFRQLFEEGLELQKQQLREQRAYAKEKQLEHQRRHQDHIESLENYYKDQFSLLAEKLAQERQDIQVRKRAQEKALLKMKRELRSRMEREIGELQKIIIQNDEEDYFQELEVQRLRNRIHMASFKDNTSYLH